MGHENERRGKPYRDRQNAKKAKAKQPPPLLLYLKKTYRNNVIRRFHTPCSVFNT